MPIVNELNPWIGVAGNLNSGANSLAETLLRVPQIRTQLQQAGLNADTSRMQNQLLQGQVQQQPQQFAQQQAMGAANLQGQQNSNAIGQQQLTQMQPTFDLLQKLNQAKLTGEQQNVEQGKFKQQQVQTQADLQKSTGDAVARVLTAKLSGQEPDPKDIATLTSGMVQQGSPQAEQGVLQQVGMGKPNNALPADLVRLYGSTANANPGMDPGKIAQQIPGIFQTLMGATQGGGQQQTQQPPTSQIPPPQQRQVGQVVQTPKGRFKWNGQGWDPAQ